MREQNGSIILRSGKWYVSYWDRRNINGTVERKRVTIYLGKKITQGKHPPPDIEAVRERYMAGVNAPVKKQAAKMPAVRPKFDYPEFMIKLHEYPPKKAGLWHKFEPSTNPIEPWPLPALPGCYAIFAEGALLYIGQSQNVYRRIREHGIRRYRGHAFTPWGAYSNVFIKVRKPVMYGDWLMAEQKLIRRLDPPGNRMGSVQAKERAYANPQVQ